MDIKYCHACNKKIDQKSDQSVASFVKMKYHFECRTFRKAHYERHDKIYKKPTGGDPRYSYKYHLSRLQTQNE